MQLQFQPQPTSVLCSKHFEEHFIDPSVFRTRLRPGSIPTLFEELPMDLPNKNSGINCKNTVRVKQTANGNNVSVHKEVQHKITIVSVSNILAKKENLLRPSNDTTTTLPPVIPKTEPILPTTDPIIPKTEPILPTTDPILPTTDPKLPTTDPILPTTEPILPKIEPILPTTDPILPTTDPILPTTEPILPKIEPILPTTHPIVLKTYSILPTTDPIQPTTHPIQPTTHPILPTIDPKLPAKHVCTSMERLKKKLIIKNKKIKTLQQQSRRLKKKVAQFSDIIEELKKKIDSDDVYIIVPN
ncbi:zonadhesin-like isoform X2 [Spodoptera litura]|nr:zonadhesin-like isoform X2 [Spodoptera litura]XP_022818419.1 zonadhesin-like isoform X2 [Spodoptera litura]